MTQVPEAPTAAELLNGSGGGVGARAASFLAVGDTIAGIVRSCTVLQQTKKQPAGYTGEPEYVYWDKAEQRPKWQLVVTVDNTGVFDPSLDEDDGSRAIYAKGDPKDPTSGMGAIANECARAGDDEPKPGSWLRLTMTGEGTSEKSGFERKYYEAEYRSVVAVELQGVPTGTASRQSKVTGKGGTPAGGAAAPAALAGMAPPPGMDPATWAAYLASQGQQAAPVAPAAPAAPVAPPAAPAAAPMTPAQVAALMSTQGATQGAPQAPIASPPVDAVAMAAQAQQQAAQQQAAQLAAQQAAAVPPTPQAPAPGAPGAGLVPPEVIAQAQAAGVDPVDLFNALQAQKG